MNTTDPGYVKWTQWIFLQLFKQGLAYEGTIPINWCPSCKTGLANEEVTQGRCERCGKGVERKDMRQWLLRITRYAARLLKDLALVDWPESTLAMQRNWIGRSEGAEAIFRIADKEGWGTSEEVKVFLQVAPSLTLLIQKGSRPTVFTGMFTRRSHRLRSVTQRASG